MGNNEYRSQELSQYAPQMHNYTLTHCYSPLSIYRHLYNAEEIMQFKESIHNTLDIDRKVQTFIARYQHIYLVSSLFMKLETNNNCANSQYELKIYYQRVVTNLSKINQISFKDALHCLAVSLKGFQILYKNFGYFQVFQNMFHICQRGKLKIWCNQNIYKNVPQQYLLGQGKEEDMVVRIINIIDQNMDPSCRIFPVKQALVNLKKITFSNAILALRQICRENQFTISQNLQSLENFSQFQSVLDIYTPPKRFPKETLVTFYPKGNKSGGNTPIRSRSSSSHRTTNKVAGSRGKSQQNNSNNKEHHKFEVTVAQEDQFPKFIAGRQKNYSKSNSSSLKQASSPRFSPSYVQKPHPHPHLQQFSKINTQQSQLKKKNIILNQTPSQVIKYSNTPQQIQYQNQPIYANRSFQNRVSAPIPQQILVQRPLSPHVIQRQASTPILTASKNIYLPHNTLQNTNSRIYHGNSNTTHMNNNYSQQNIRYPIHIVNNQGLSRSRHLEVNQNRQPHYHVNSNQYVNQPKQQIISYQKRGFSVPIKMSYQGINPKDISYSPKKQEDRKKPSIHLSSNKNYQNIPKERLITLGETSGKKQIQNVNNHIKNDKKEDKFQFTQLAQLQSKIQLLQSFAQNKITTQQFLPNQSHALSNIKWQKNSNSGRDSVTSTFRKDILLQLSNKPSQKKDQWKKQQSLLRKQSYKQKDNKFEDGGFYTNQGLLQLIKAGASPKSHNFEKASFDDKMKKYEQKYSKQDIIKQLSTKSNESSKQYNHYAYKYTDNYVNSYNMFNQDNNKATVTPTFGSYEKTSFKKKTQPYQNKISAISQKWQQQNICSTSNGSRNMNIQSSNIDEDILEDMHNQGFGMVFAKKSK